MHWKGLNWFRVGGIGFATLLAAAGAARTETAGRERASDVAFISVPEPRVATLLQLRGMAGRGVAVYRLDGRCEAMAVRLVAGDFAGLDEAGGGVRPITLRIARTELVRALADGQDLVSDMITTSADPADTGVDVTVLGGLAVGTGFVINPGSSFLADMFGAPVEAVPCSRIDALAASHAVGPAP